MIKLASWAAELADALRGRGVEAAVASLASEVGVAAFRVAFDRWVHETSQSDLPELIRESLDELRALTAEDGRSRSISSPA